MNRIRKANRSDHGVALVTTVIVVAVLAVVAAAMLQSTTVDRLSSRSALNYAQAKLAAESALAFAEQQILSATTNETFIVVANTQPTIRTDGSAVTVSNSQLFVGNGLAGSSDFNYLPLFSSTDTLTNIVAPIRTNVMPRLSLPSPGSTNPPATTVFSNQMPGGFTAVSPLVSWVYLTQTVTNANNQVSTVTNARFAYWVEDLGGKLDLSVIGTNTTDPVARRPTGTNPAEIAFWATLTNAVAAGASRQAGDLVIAARSNLVTPATARIVALNVSTNAGLMAELTANLRHDTNEPEMIPFGFGYPDAGRPKYDLNTNIATSAVTNLADIIGINLPEFAQRAGGFTNAAGGGATNSDAYTASSYLRTIAASIIDYADTDSTPTTDGAVLSTNRFRPVFRGVDSHPFISEVSKRWRLTTNAIMTVDGTLGRGIVIETTDFFELWNPTSQTANGTLTVVSVHQQSGQSGFLNFNFGNPIYASNSSGRVLNGVSTNVFGGLGIPPNGFVVRRGSTVTNFFFSPVTNSNPVVLRGEVDSSRYHAAWNGVFYDAVLGGLFRAPFNANWASSGLALNAPTNRANLPGFVFRSPGGSGFADPAVGDPRATIYLSRPVDAIDYTSGTSWWGRNLRGGINRTNPYAEVSPRTWPDNGHDSPAGLASSAQSTEPDTIGPGIYSNVPPSRISNAGLYLRVTELGAIFDPIQWRESSLGVWQGKWTNLTTNATADNGYGGGNTLRIGRAEHPRFAQDGLRAAQLMDLFAVGPTNNAGVVLNRTAGRINLNTAGTNALRALAAGVAHSRDPALQVGGTNFFIPTNAVNLFVQGVRDFRSVRPFRAVSELPAISATTNTNARWPENSVFGNSNSEVAGVQAWNDAAAEEWFGKIHALTTVRSRNFMIHSIGQWLNTNNPGQPLSSYQISRQVYVAPMRDPTNGVITNARVEAVQTWAY